MRPIPLIVGLLVTTTLAGGVISTSSAAVDHGAGVVTREVALEDFYIDYQKTALAPGDRVVLTPTPSCGECYWCVRDEHSLCADASAIVTSSFPDGSTPDAIDVARIAGNLFAAGQETTVRLASMRITRQTTAIAYHVACTSCADPPVSRSIARKPMNTLAAARNVASASAAWYSASAAFSSSRSARNAAICSRSRALPRSLISAASRSGSSPPCSCAARCSQASPAHPDPSAPKKKKSVKSEESVLFSPINKLAEENSMLKDGGTF